MSNNTERSSIYVIADEYRYDDRDGRSTSDTVINEEYGFFLSAEDAEAFVESQNGPSREAYQLELDRYREREREEVAKVERARDAGFSHHMAYLVMPSEPRYLSSVAVAPHG